MTSRLERAPGETPARQDRKFGLTVAWKLIVVPAVRATVGRGKLAYASGRGGRAASRGLLEAVELLV